MNDGRRSLFGAVADQFHASTTNFAFHGARLRFDLARTVFAGANVDPGSALLLRYLQTVEITPGARVLDLGCGHGTLGIVLQALDAERRVTYVDRDALACQYTARNLELNELQLSEGSILGSLGYDDLDPSARFDLVVSNIPGKVGDAVIEHIVLGARAAAAPGAVVGFVVVKPLVSLLSSLVERAGYELLVNKGNKTHEVFIARTGERVEAAERSASGFESGFYDRGTVDFSFRELAWTTRTVVGLDEFDTLSQATRLLRQSLQGVRSSPCLIVNPGQGHRALIAAKVGYRPAAMVSRDLLSLRASARALTDAGFEQPTLDHAIATDPELLDEYPLLILHADDKVHAPWLYGEVERYLAWVSGRTDTPHTELVLTGRSGVLGRLEADLLNRRPGAVAYKHGVKGHRVLRFIPKQPNR